jgi:hypothetical protein
MAHNPDQGSMEFPKNPDSARRGARHRGQHERELGAEPLNVRRALTFVFQNRRWRQKLGVAVILNMFPAALVMVGLLSRYGAVPPMLATAANSPLWPFLTGLVGIPLSGYVLRITRQVVAGHDLPLPDWSDITGILRDGLMLWAVITLWQLPVVILEYLSGLSDGDPLALTLGEVLLALGGLLVTPVTLLTQMIQPAAEARLAATGSFVAGIDVVAAVRVVGANIGGYVRLWLVTVVVLLISWGPGLGLVMLGNVLGGGPLDWPWVVAAGLVVGNVILGPYTSFVLYHLTGQVYARTRENTRLANGRASDPRR